MKGKFLIGLVLMVLVTACSGHKTSFRNEDEMNTYLNDPANGFITSVETADLIVEAKLSPSIKNDKVPQITVQMRISRKDGGSVLDFGGVAKTQALEREGYLSFEILKDVFLESNGKVEPAIFHHYERNYGLKPSVDIFFKFKNFEPSSDVYFNYRDQLFGQGLIKLKFNKDLFTSCYVQE